MIRRIRRDEDGTALVEFALVLPLLAIICFGTIDLGRVYQTYTAVKNSARAGAGFAQGHPGWAANSGDCADPDNIPWHAQHESNNTTGFSVAVANVTTSATLNTCDTTSTFSGNQIKVTVKKSNFVLVTPFIQRIFGTLDVSSSVSVRAQ